ncbi:MAG: hypothetical protein UIH27_12380 [Ruminococcus sp.]|nr:hypothetical protein [Ruminococcus sp.]
MPTLDENLIRLQNAKTAIANAITAKGGTVGANDGLEEFPQAILSLAGQSGTIVPSNVKNSVEPGTTAYNLARLVDAKIDIGNAIAAKGGTVGANDGLEEFATDIDTIQSQKIYGFHINSSVSDPSKAVTYLEDAVGKTPASMNYTSGTFSYGSWDADEFFMPRPCMLNSNGTVAYYLNPNDYTKKADGTASDIANTSFNGNAMMEWGRDGKKIWYKIVPDSGDNTSASIYIADNQVDNSYHAYNFIKSDGSYVDHFYTPIYNGSLISNKLRSISGQTIIASKTADEEISYATANGSGWYTETWSDTELINVLLILLGKSLDTQTVFGCGNMSGSSYLNTGTMNDKGLFWGKNASSSSDNSGVKVFGMENYWGNQYRRIAGLLYTKSGGYKVKYAYGTSDGSTASTYSSSGTGYISTGIGANGSSGYLTKMDFSLGKMLHTTTSGSGTTYYCDYTYYGTSIYTYYAYRGGSRISGRGCGAFCLLVYGQASDAGSSFGASLSFRG